MELSGKKCVFQGFKVWPHFLFSATWLPGGLALLVPRLPHPDGTCKPKDSLFSSKLLFDGVFYHLPEELFSFHSLWICCKSERLPKGHTAMLLLVTLTF